MINGKTVDTSVWIEFINTTTGKKNPLLREIIKNDELVMIPVIMQEVLQGMKEDTTFTQFRDAFLNFKILDSNQTGLAIKAASLYRFLRKKGITIRKPNDCLIAVTCIEENISLIHNDKDFDNIAKYTSLKIYK